MTNLFDDEEKLIELKIQLEVEKRVEKIKQDTLSEITNDPDMVIKAYMDKLSLVEERVLSMIPKVEAHDKFIRAKGEVSCDAAADSIILDYITEKGKIKRMGRNYIIEVLKYDGIIRQDYEGYKLHSAFKQYGRTQTSNVGGYIYTSVKFSAKGIAYLEKRYSQDKRTWSVTNGKLSC